MGLFKRKKPWEVDFSFLRGNYYFAAVKRAEIALSKLSDDERREILQAEPRENIRAQIVQCLPQNSPLLLELMCQDESRLIRNAARKRTNQDWRKILSDGEKVTVYRDMATGSSEERVEAVKMLHDPEITKKALQDQYYPSVRSAAVDAIDDADTLIETALHHSDRDIRNRAVNRILKMNKEILVKLILLPAKYNYLVTEKIEQIHNENMLAKIALSPVSSYREKALRNIQQASTLLALAEKTVDDYFRVLVWERLVSFPSEDWKERVKPSATAFLASQLTAPSFAPPPDSHLQVSPQKVASILKKIYRAGCLQPETIQQLEGTVMKTKEHSDYGLGESSCYVHVDETYPPEVFTFSE